MFGIIERYKHRKAQEQHERGFDHAAGELLMRGEAAIEDLESKVQCSRDFDVYNQFDRGIEDAIELFNKQGVK